MTSRLILIEGLPGSGKSSLARALHERITGSHLYHETDGPNPFHVVPVDDRGASFETIHSWTAAEIAERSLGNWFRFVESAPPGVHIAESYPFQSGSRMLCQVDAEDEAVLAYLRAVEQTVACLEPRLIKLTHEDLEGSISRISAIRGPEWTDFVLGFMERTPWAKARRLTGWEAAIGFMKDVERLSTRFLAESSMPVLELPGGAHYGEGTVDAALAWLAEDRV